MDDDRCGYLTAEQVCHMIVEIYTRSKWPGPPQLLDPERVRTVLQDITRQYISVVHARQGGRRCSFIDRLHSLPGVGVSHILCKEVFAELVIWDDIAQFFDPPIRSDVFH